MRSWRRYPNCASPDDAFTVSHRSSHRAARRPRGRVLHVAHNGRLFFAARAPSSRARDRSARGQASVSLSRASSRAPDVYISIRRRKSDARRARARDRHRGVRRRRHGAGDDDDAKTPTMAKRDEASRRHPLVAGRSSTTTTRVVVCRAWDGARAQPVGGGGASTECSNLQSRIGQLHARRDVHRLELLE